MEIKLKDFIESGKIVALVNFSGSFHKLKNNSKISYVLESGYRQNIKVQKYFEKIFPSFSKEKFYDACKMTLLDPTVLECNLSRLSMTEAKKLRLVEALLWGSDTIVLVHFERGFYQKSRQYYQKLFQKLTKYGKCVVVVTNDISFLFGFVSSFYFFSSQHLELLHDFYLDKIYQYVDMPPIVSYVKYLEKQGLMIDHYIEPKELLKAIYRSVNSGDRL